MAESWKDKLPSEDSAVYEPHLQLFFETMYERQMIWWRRFWLKQKAPWTENPIFKNSKFTNVYRELDRNSQWLIKNVILDHSLTTRDLIWKIMLFRFFNEPATFELAKAGTGGLFSVPPRPWKNGIPSYDEYNQEEFREHIKAVRMSGQNPFTTAYLINSKTAPHLGRDECYCTVTIPALHKAVPGIVDMMMGYGGSIEPEDFIKHLKLLPGVADFIAHEFYQDFTYIKRYTNKEIFPWDQNDWTNVGPGASVGIRLIFPNLKGKSQQTAGIYRLKSMAASELAKIGEKRGENFPYLDWHISKRKYEIYFTQPNITLHQIEMWLCEFQKYWKMIIGEGKQRLKFRPTSKGLL